MYLFKIDKVSSDSNSSAELSLSYHPVKSKFSTIFNSATLTEYNLIQSIPGKINKCILFPGEYFHKFNFPRGYLDLPMRTQVMILK